MKRLAVLLLCVPATFAHVVSMSTGDMTISRAGGHYEFRLPLYEAPPGPDPGSMIFAHLNFSSAGQPARLLRSACRQDGTQGVLVCSADYEFARAIDSLDVDCTLYSITVPNHIHLLRAVNGAKRDQALLDISFPHATLRFRPPTALETVFQQTAGGALRALAGPAQVLFLICLVVAARTRRELMFLVAMFASGQIITVLAVTGTVWQPAPRFVEAAAALTIAYLAIEILLLPKAGLRWLIVAILGAFHGLYFAIFLRTTGYRAGSVLAGAITAEIVVTLLGGFLFAAIARRLALWKPVPVSATALFVAGMAWFVMRLRG